MKLHAGVWHRHRQRGKGAPSSASAGTDSTGPLKSGSWAPGPPWWGLNIYSGFANRLDTPSESQLSSPPSQPPFQVSKDTPRLLHTPPGSECSGVPGIPACDSKAHLTLWACREDGARPGTALGLPSPGRSHHLWPGLHTALLDTPFQKAV